MKEPNWEEEVGPIVGPNLQLIGKGNATGTYFFNRRGINIDITHRCPLECKRCQRFTSFTSKGLKVPGEDITMENFSKILNYFNHINFCGQVSDPVHHPKFIELLEKIYSISKRARCTCSVHHASAGKPLHWYPKAFQANPNAQWWFGIDGLPEDSHKYRTNQDGVKLFNILKESVKHLNVAPIWQYIVFRYNENDIEKAKNMATDIGAKFVLVNSSRWIGEDDPLKPTNKNLSLNLRDKGKVTTRFGGLHEFRYLNEDSINEKKRKEFNAKK
jgi:MoaA/NifB/PqqE/SkfB family radical SAM enzyme